MRIAQITFLGISGLADASFDLRDARDAAPDVVLFTGPAASGKTRALEAIVAAKEAIAPYGPAQPGAPWIAAGSPLAKVALRFHLDEEEQTFADLMQTEIDAEVQFFRNRNTVSADEGVVAVLNRYVHKPKVGKLEYFSARRHIPEQPPFGGTGALEQRGLRPTKYAHKYGFVPRLLREIADDAAKAAEFEGRLAALSTTCRYVRGGPVDPLPRCFASRSGWLLTWAQLSASEADAVLFAATATVIGLDRSLVLIDRPELHAAPGEAARFFAGLRKLGTGNQILAATSSPEILGAEGARVVELRGVQEEPR